MAKKIEIYWIKGISWIEDRVQLFSNGKISLSATLLSVPM